MRKKNTAIRPSLIHRNSGFDRPPPFRVIDRTDSSVPL